MHMWLEQKKYVLNQTEREAIEWMAKVARMGGQATLDLVLDSCAIESLHLCLTTQGALVSLTLQTISHQEAKVTVTHSKTIGRACTLEVKRLWSSTPIHEMVCLEEGWSIEVM